jgi:hypothetical protein
VSNQVITLRGGILAGLQPWPDSENSQESEDFLNGIGGAAGSAKLTRVALG